MAKGPLVLLRNLKPSDTNLIVAMAALVTSVVAVVIAWDESRVLREAYRTAFTPIIDVRAGLDFSESEPSVFGIDVRNVGPGVARIESARMRYAGEQVGIYADFASAMFNPFLAREAAIASAPSIGYLKADEDRRVLALEWTTFQGNRSQLREWVADRQADSLSRFDFVVCYCSLFEECWEAHANRTAPVKVAACEATGDPTTALDRSLRGGGT